MKIALIAQNKKKEQMIRFCLTYASILARHELYATGGTGRMIQDTTGLKVHCFLSGRQGGDQQIGEHIAYDEMDMLIAFRDTLTSGPSATYESMLRLCDTHGVPYATNLATAEALMFVLKNNELGISHIKSE